MAVLLATGTTHQPAARAAEISQGPSAIALSLLRGATAATDGWLWPVPVPVVVSAPFRQPAHTYGAGHRGIDLVATGTVTSPADGTIAFVGSVAGRPLMTIAHAGDLVTTLEPVISTVAVGDRVSGGDVVATISTGGHAVPGSLHFGVRLRGEYINPQLLVGTVPRAILLPCCER